MDLLTQLGYRYPKRNAVRRGVVRLATTRPVAWFLARVLPVVDRQLLKLSSGRMSFAELTGGTPVITLTTRGARTGEPRSHVLLGIPLVDTIAIIGTNFAQAATPAWVHNLMAQPRATVTYRRSQVVVIARAVTGSEYEQVFAAAALVYPGYRAYRARLTHRQPKVFVLEPDTAETTLTPQDPST